MSILKVEEINEIIEMKMTHRKNIERRKAKFGFDSDSKMGLNMVGAAVVVPDASDGTEPENPYDGKIRQKILLTILYFQMPEIMWPSILPSWISQGGLKLNIRLRLLRETEIHTH